MPSTPSRSSVFSSQPDWLRRRSEEEDRNEVESTQEYLISFQRSKQATRYRDLETKAGDPFAGVGVVVRSYRLRTKAQNNPAGSIVNNMLDKGESLNISQDLTEILNYIAAAKASTIAKKTRIITPLQATTINDSVPSSQATTVDNTKPVEFTIYLKSVLKKDIPDNRTREQSHLQDLNQSPPLFIQKSKQERLMQTLSLNRIIRAHLASIKATTMHSKLAKTRQQAINIMDERQQESIGREIRNFSDRGFHSLEVEIVYRFNAQATDKSTTTALESRRQLIRLSSHVVTPILSNPIEALIQEREIRNESLAKKLHKEILAM